MAYPQCCLHRARLSGCCRGSLTDGKRPCGVKKIYVDPHGFFDGQGEIFYCQIYSAYPTYLIGLPYKFPYIHLLSDPLSVERLRPTWRHTDHIL